jgi:hypothetical protein
MSESTSSIEAVSRLIADEHQRERFLDLMGRLRNLPEDDEQLQFMEIVGFTTLILKQIPNEIAAVVEKAQSGLSDDQVDVLQRRFETILKDSVDTPSYKDLREMVGQMKEERQQFKQTVEGLSHDIISIPCVPTPGTFTTKSVVWIGIACLLIGSLLTGLIAMVTRSPSLRIRAASSGLDPITDFVSYFEDTIPELGGDVGVYVVEGGIVSVEKQPDRGLVVVALPTSNGTHR